MEMLKSYKDLCWGGNGVLCWERGECPTSEMTQSTALACKQAYLKVLERSYPTMHQSNICVRDIVAITYCPLSLPLR